MTISGIMNDKVGKSTDKRNFFKDSFKGKLPNTKYFPQ